MEKVFKKELINDVATRTGLSKKVVDTVLVNTLNAIQAFANDGKKVVLINFGSFYTRERKERTGRNPRTGKAITIPAKKSLAFHGSKNEIA